MRRRNSCVLAFIVTAVVTAGGLAGPAGTPARAAGSVDWAPCAENAEIECGTVAVPVDWADPTGPAIDLALARHRATDPAARIGSLVVNPGGPGGSGVNSVLGSTFDGELARRFDIVGFDPRGVARSAPILCSLDAILALPPRFTDQAGFDGMVSASRTLADDCRSRSGPVFDHVDTGQTVRDIDAVRAALGDPQLTFFGMSYGTLMAQQYAEAFPGRVRAVVADSNMDHSLDAPSWFATEAHAMQDMFQAFVSGCTAISSCALAGRDIPQFWARLLTRAARGELPDPDAPGTGYSQADLINLMAGYLMYDAYWLPLAETLRNIDEGRPSNRALRASAKAVEEQAARLSPFAIAGAVPFADLALPAADEPPTVVNFSYQAIFCQDWNLPAADYAAWSALVAEAKAAAPDFPFVPRAESPPAICLGWNGAVHNPQQPISARPDTPLLLVNSLHDEATGYIWATGAAAQFGPAAVLLTYDGTGHISYGRTACIDDAIITYLTTQALPARGTHCAAAPVPGTEGTTVAEAATSAGIGGDLVPDTAAHGG
jgi:pimeloyl-ACP methyl ester carboxylesterase